MLFAMNHDGLFRSTNDGWSWTAVNTGMPRTEVIALAVIGKNLFAGTRDSGILLSTNKGTSWTSVNTGLPKSTGVGAFGVSGNNLFASTDSGVYLTTNSGATWTVANTGFPIPTMLRSTFVLSFAANGKNIFAGTNNDGVYLSTNNGANWTAVNNGLTYATIFSLAAIGSNLVAGTAGGGVYLSTNNGTSWTPVNSGLQISSWDYALATVGTNLFLGAGGSGVWKRSVSEMISSGVSPSVPASYTLNQNYPNPFNPSTEISFVLAERCIVQLDVFDMLGRKLQTLVNGAMDAGSHSVKFDAGDLPSGIYATRLTANGGQREMKMILNK